MPVHIKIAPTAPRTISPVLEASSEELDPAPPEPWVGLVEKTLQKAKIARPK